VIDDLAMLHRLGVALEVRTTLPGNSRNCMTVRDLLIETLLKVRSKRRGLVPLRPNRAQRTYSQQCNRRNIVLKARQVGITTYIAARFFVQTITQPGTLTVQVAHDQESAEDIFKIVHRFWENLPEGMRKGALRTSRANVRQLAFPRLDSEYRVATAADASAGRGTTIHHLHCSEVARWPDDAEEALTSLREAVPESGEVVIESTPNGAGGTFYEEWERAGETGYTRHFFPWWCEDEYRVEPGQDLETPLTPEEQHLVEEHALTPAQMAWRRIKRAQLRGLAVQEYAEDAISCFRTSGECVFDLEAIEQALQNCGEPWESRENERICLWFPPQPGKEYIVGVDPAGGGSEGDYSCAEVIERRTGLQCAELHGHLSPGELARKLVELGGLYNHGLLAVERNNHGYGVLAHLQMAGYENVYSSGKQVGWLTSAVTRPAMIENLAATLVADAALFRSQRLLRECRTFVRHGDGSSRAAAGTHDDCVMAMAIALGVRAEVAGKHHGGSRLELASLPVKH
jgi:terminase large subunit-like protein